MIAPSAPPLPPALTVAAARRILRAFVRGEEALGWARLALAFGGRLPFDPSRDRARAEALLDAIDDLVSPEDDPDETDTVTLAR